MKNINIISPEKDRMTHLNKKPFQLSVTIPIIIGIIAISFSSIFVKWSAAPVSVQGMYRLLITVIMMIPFVWKHLGLIKSLTKREFFLLLSSGVLLAMHFLFWMGSLTLTTVASSTILLSLQPVFVMIGAFYAFHEKSSKTALLSMTVAIFGAAIIGWGDIGISPANIQGDLFSLLGTIAVAVHMLISQKLLKTIPSSLYSFIVFLIGVMVFAMYNFSLNIPMTGYSKVDWFTFLLLAVVPTVFGHVLFNWLLKYVSASTISMAILGEPVGASLLAYFLLDESLTFPQCIGGFIVLGGLFFFLKNTRKQLNPKQPARYTEPFLTGAHVENSITHKG
jgi:drug/metabolite transporter (DMT)-like permease